MKLSDFVMDFVEKQGVKDIFMLPGGGCIHLVDSLGKSELNFVCNLHEQASSIAADAYAQFTNNLGVCLVTTGSCSFYFGTSSEKRHEGFPSSTPNWFSRIRHG